MWLKNFPIALVDLYTGEPIGNNRARQTMLGCSEEELSHFATFNELTYPPNRQLDAELFNELCMGRLDDLRMEKHFVLKDGRSVWSNAIFTLLRDSDLGPRYIIVIHEDITERKRALEKLQAQKQELRRSAAFLTQAQHLSSTGSFAWHVSTTNEITWSDELYRIFDLDRAAPITTERIRMRVHPEDIAQFDKTVLRARTTGEDFECQYRLLLPDNSVKYLRVVAKATRHSTYLPVGGIPGSIQSISMSCVKQTINSSTKRFSLMVREMGMISMSDGICGTKCLE